MDDRSDGQLLAAWTAAGDVASYEVLVRRHESPLLRHARALLGDWRAGEDVVQEVLLRLAQKPPRMPETASGDVGRERAALSSWLHRVTRNLCMDALRSESRRKHREEAAASMEASDGGLAAIAEGETREVVERGLEKLPLDQREVLVLRLLGEKSYKEIAEITGKKAGTVGWLISVGLKALSDELAPLLGAPGSAPVPSPEVGTLQGGMS